MFWKTIQVIISLMFLDDFNVLILKIKKYFIKHPTSQYPILIKSISISKSIGKKKLKKEKKLLATKHNT